MQADIVSYTDPGAFLAATSGVATQTFGQVATNLGVGVDEAVQVNNPLDNTTNSAILPGLEINATSSMGGDIIVLGPAFMGLTNPSVFTFWGAGMNFTFTGGATAASIDVLHVPSPDDVTVTALGVTGNVLGVFTVPEAPSSGAGEFIGFTTGGGDVIAALDLSGSPFLGADQVQFGSAGAATPEPSFFALTGLGFAGLVTFTVRRKRKLTA
jgi:hypothetical protein